MGLTSSIIIGIVYFISLYFSIFLVLVYVDISGKMKSEESELEPEKYPRVSILIPAYNEENTIEGTMVSVRDINYPKDKLDVILIDDGSKDRTHEKMKIFIESNDVPHFRILSHDNMGKAASMNKAIEMAKGEFFACLDADSYVDKNTLRKMLSMFYKENNDQLAVITPAMKVFKPKGVLQKIQWIEYLLMIFAGRLTSHLDSIYVAPGPFSLYRKDIIEKLGGFDVKTLTEDQEIAYRLQENHYQIKQCFDGYVYTVSPRKIIPFYKQRRRWYMGGMECAYDYRKVIGNKEYGDFGLIQMVKNIFGYGLGVIGIGIASYLVFWPMFKAFMSWLSIGFDIMPYLKTFTFTFSPLLLDVQKLLVFGMLFGVGLFFFIMAHRNAKEKVNGVGLLPIIPYFAGYYLLKGAILLLCFFEFGRRKKIKW